MFPRNAHAVLGLIWLYCFLAHTLVSVAGQILNCEGDDPCRCTFSDGSGVLDISSVGNRDGSARFPDALSYDGLTYAFNPCFSFSAVSGCSNAAICQKDLSGSFNRLATQKSSYWSYNGFYPVLTYSNTDGKKTEVSMICDPSFVNPQLDVFGEITPGVLSMNLWSNCACPNTCERVGPSGSTGEGLTAGSVMLIIFFSLLFVYLIGGMAFNYHRQKEMSRTMVPNASFWAALPGLIKDGTAFTIAKVRGRESGVYTSTLPPNSETSLMHGK